MTDKKLTDAEIVKALECCMDEMGCKKGCPCFDPKSKGSHCTVSKKIELEKLTIDLINRQQAEIEKLNETLNATITGQETLQKYIATTKAEAYKEFAERLLKKELESEYFSHIAYQALNFDTNNLLKELVGENETV